MYYLYVKIHNKTGIGYLGYTTKDISSYKGSGLYWQRHLKKHGNDVSTFYMNGFNTLEELKEQGIFLSKLFDVVNSDKWANLTEECGNGHQFTKEECQKGQRKSRGNPLGIGCKFTREQRQRGGGKGKIWINNGIKSVRIFPQEQLPIGYTKGRLTPWQ